MLGQKRSSLEEIATLEEITKLLALQSSTGLTGLGPKKTKTKASKTFDCGIEDGSRICSGKVSVRALLAKIIFYIRRGH